MVLMLHKYVTYLLRYLPTYLQSRNPHKAATLDFHHTVNQS